MHRRASRKTGTFGTSLKISSVTREPIIPSGDIQGGARRRRGCLPFKLRIHLSSKFFSKLSSASDKLSGIDDRARRAIKKSIETPWIFAPMTGTYASGTPFEQWSVAIASSQSSDHAL